jgi:hypothetical protein
MKLIRSPKRGWCLPTAFAMCLDIVPQDVVDKIGHDGQEVINPDKDEPECFRGFHTQELIDACVMLGHWVTQIQCCPGHDTGPIWQVDKVQSRTEMYLMLPHRMVITGYGKSNVGHAVAYQGGKIYDPVGKVYGIEASTQNHFSLFDSIFIITTKHSFKFSE